MLITIIIFSFIKIFQVCILIKPVQRTGYIPSYDINRRKAKLSHQSEMNKVVNKNEHVSIDPTIKGIKLRENIL